MLQSSNPIERVIRRAQNLKTMTIMQIDASTQSAATMVLPLSTTGPCESDGGPPPLAAELADVDMTVKTMSEDTDDQDLNGEKACGGPTSNGEER
ncbi:hypothetical protein MMC11_000661 [Xylographa trunciseda]|nr:hypothetical protein [Xylographa trunciseda]